MCPAVPVTVTDDNQRSVCQALLTEKNVITLHSVSLMDLL